MGNCPCPWNVDSELNQKNHPLWSQTHRIQKFARIAKAPIGIVRECFRQKIEVKKGDAANQRQKLSDCCGS
jgi:hypothetical protein